MSLEITPMQEVVLSHAEFLAALETVHATAIVGASATSLFPQEEKERTAVLGQGRALLEQRLAVLGDQAYDELLQTARITAYPHVAIMVIREVIPHGRQLFVLSQAPEGIIEHTCPRPGVHRLAPLPDVPALIARAAQLLSVPKQVSMDASVDIERDAFFQLHDLVRRSQHERALEMLQRAGMPSTPAEAFVAAMEQPNFSGEAVLLKCADQTIIDARDIVMVQGRQTAWYVMQVTPGQTCLRVQALHSHTMRDVLSRCFAELAA